MFGRVVYLYPKELVYFSIWCPSALRPQQILFLTPKNRYWTLLRGFSFPLATLECKPADLKLSCNCRVKKQNSISSNLSINNKYIYLPTQETPENPCHTITETISYQDYGRGRQIRAAEPESDRPGRTSHPVQDQEEHALPEADARLLRPAKDDSEHDPVRLRRKPDQGDGHAQVLRHGGQRRHRGVQSAVRRLNNITTGPPKHV